MPSSGRSRPSMRRNRRLKRPMRRPRKPSRRPSKRPRKPSKRPSMRRRMRQSLTHQPRTAQRRRRRQNLLPHQPRQPRHSADTFDYATTPSLSSRAWSVLERDVTKSDASLKPRAFDLGLGPNPIEVRTPRTQLLRGCEELVGPHGFGQKAEIALRAGDCDDFSFIIIGIG